MKLVDKAENKEQSDGKNTKKYSWYSRERCPCLTFCKQTKSKHQWRKLCDTWCRWWLLHLPTQVSQETILSATGQKQRKKPTPLSPRGAQRQKRGKKTIQHLCLLRLKHVAFSASLPSSLHRCNSTWREMYCHCPWTLLILGCSKKKSALLFLFPIVWLSLWCVSWCRD